MAILYYMLLLLVLHKLEETNVPQDYHCYYY